MMKRLRGKKEKKSKKQTEQPGIEKDENNDVKEVLQLFNKLEELVIDGDPRIRQVLDEKPGFQALLRDDSSMFGLSPRSEIIPEQQLLNKEATNSSILSQTKPGLSQLTMDRSQVLYPNQNLSSVRKRHILVPPIAIPENATARDMFQDGYYPASIKTHPDGTLESSRLNENISKTNPTYSEKPKIQYSEYKNQTMQTDNLNVNPSKANVTVPLTVINSIEAKPNRELKTNTPTKFHSFQYSKGHEKSIVQIQLNDWVENGTITRNKSVDLVKNNEPQKDYESRVLLKTSNVENQTREPDIQHQYKIPMKGPINDLSMAMISKVIDASGGSLECFACSIKVPKNAIQSKCLFQLGILEASHVPHKSDRILHYYNNQTGSTIMPVSPTIHIEPAEIQFAMPITIQLPTSVTLFDDDLNRRQTYDASLEKPEDIKTDQLCVKRGKLSTKDEWKTVETEVFISSDSVLFKVFELGSIGTFLKSKYEQEYLTKRFALFMFKSCDFRKHQFISLMVCEDLPHVIQKGIQSIPKWLTYVNSSSNILLKEGKNLIIYIEPENPELCHVDANKLEIPWENLWHPESTIRKHLRVTLLKLDTDASVKITLESGQIEFISKFAWKVKLQKPNLFNFNSIPLDFYTGSNNENAGGNNGRLDSEMYKKVTWNVETPPNKFVTNKELLAYASM